MTAYEQKLILHALRIAAKEHFNASLEHPSSYVERNALRDRAEEFRKLANKIANKRTNSRLPIA